MKALKPEFVLGEWNRLAVEVELSDRDKGHVIRYTLRKLFRSSLTLAKIAELTGLKSHTSTLISIGTVEDSTPLKKVADNFYTYLHDVQRGYSWGKKFQEK
jgi:hypothetical protein